MQWQADVGPVPHHIGALLVLAADGRSRPDDLVAVLSARLAGIPPLRRRPVKPPAGGGGWYWIDDDRDPRQHLTTTPVVATDTQALLDAATRSLTTPRSPGLSPWTATVLTGPDGSAAGVVIVLHHVLADGISGLAALTALVDGADRSGPGTGPASTGVPAPPGRRLKYAVLVHDAWSRRLQALRTLIDPRRARTALREGRAELGGGAPAPRSVLNRPTGPHRAIRTVDADESAVRAAAHVLGASVNDLVLVAVVEALRGAAADSGEALDHLVVSVPVATRAATLRMGDHDHVNGGADSSPRNSVGVMPIAVPATGALADRVRTVTARRHARLTGAHGRSLPLVLIAFRMVRTLHLVRWFLDRQRLVNTLVTAVPPTPGPISIAGAVVSTLVPLVLNQGNTTAAFATARYAGRLTIAVTTDPGVGPDGEALTERLSHALAELTSTPTTTH
jgi:hypothetical protein